MRESIRNISLNCINPIDDIGEARNTWLKVQANAQHSFFTSWGWIETWLNSLSDDCNASMLVGTDSGRPIFCCIIVESVSTRHRIFRKNRGYLNATGDKICDALTIEYNGILVDKDFVGQSNFLIDPLLSEIEEFCLPGIRDLKFADQYFDQSFLIRVEKQEPSYFVDLDDIRSRGDSYMGSLSSNRRTQIRKSLRQLNELGEIGVIEAGTENEALHMLDRLAQLHQKEWTTRGELGAFSSGYFVNFHRELIRRMFSDGEVQLLEIRAGEHTVGLLYCFVHEGEVLFYQSGFNYEKLKKLRPGIVSHYLAIEHNLKLGNRKYNFLGGEAQYKSSLATGHDTLYWVVASRKNMKSRIELFLRNAKRRISMRGN